ncbi:helix-turn-helix domain-containing protein [Mycobacteroides abscessus]|uniref:helix-turn-helix domain-containing protein n=2 Tax=Mycobacteroides abscessus TaxID=36809 RepID=UPI000940EA26|nr:helix-turn-helix transcriptional regulator [Mycobacteroides abscessus]
MKPHKYGLECVVMAQWDVGMHERIAGAIKQARGKRSAQWLADRTIELGYPISRAQIANYESGRKKGLDIAELIVIAAALDTSPVTLIYPGPYDRAVEFLPGCETQELVAAEWFSAAGYYRVVDGGDGKRADEYVAGRRWEEQVRPFRLSREIGLYERARDALIARGDLDDGDRERIDFYNSAIRGMRLQLGVIDA